LIGDVQVVVDLKHIVVTPFGEAQVISRCGVVGRYIALCYLRIGIDAQVVVYRESGQGRDLKLNVANVAAYALAEVEPVNGL
jgi:hypothetical protein